MASVFVTFKYCTWNPRKIIPTSKVWNPNSRKFFPRNLKNSKSVKLNSHKNLLPHFRRCRNCEPFCLSCNFSGKKVTAPPSLKVPVRLCLRVISKQFMTLMNPSTSNRHLHKNSLRLKCPCDKKKSLLFFLQIMKVCLLNTWLAKFRALIFIERPFTLSVSFGFHDPPLLTFKIDRLDLRGLDPGESDVKGSPA